MNRSSKKSDGPRLPLDAVMLLVLVLAACGGGGGDATGGDGTPVATTPTTPTLPTTPVVTGTCDLPNFQQDLLTRINALRAAGATCGSSGTFPPTTALTWNSALATAADGHAQDMATKNYFSHDSQDGRSFSDRITAAGYSWSAAGENIAAGQANVEAVMNAWINSPGHCANLMSANYVNVGVACRPAASSSNSYSKYWVMDLAKPR
ncbi:CAP domain-containing protein [Roseateles chitosanitabidus]|uniref:CAP domain-containing protein n=1 Tax=Roseateles chitosanitabidus TaxID=65048 RepID=UPI000ADE6B6A|nr:CAP domain-containing protein [Roseateles chitosanitabidus]